MYIKTGCLGKRCWLYLETLRKFRGIKLADKSIALIIFIPLMFQCCGISLLCEKSICGLTNLQGK